MKTSERLLQSRAGGDNYRLKPSHVTLAAALSANCFVMPGYTFGTFARSAKTLSDASISFELSNIEVSASEHGDSFK